MSDYDNTNTGAMFANDKQGNDKRPDRRGSLNVEGVDYWISGWLRKKKDTGEPFMSIKVERKEQRADQRGGQHSPAPARTAAHSSNQPAQDEEDDIPF